MRYINQLEYPHVPYYTRVKVEGLTREEMKRNVALSGCGLCCACMAVDHLTDKTLDIEECVRIAEDCVANYAVGTDMNVLGPAVAEKYGLVYTATNDLSALIRHVQAGGVAAALVGIPAEGQIGLFTDGGHYIFLLSTDGEEFCFMDPAYTPDRYTIPERIGRVNFANAPYLYASVSDVDREAKPKWGKYHMFARAKKG